MTCKHHEGRWTKLKPQLELSDINQAERVSEARKTGQEMGRRHQLSPASIKSPQRDNNDRTNDATWFTTAQDGLKWAAMECEQQTQTTKTIHDPGGFPRKTIEFGNHLVYQRAAFYKRKGITSAVIFLDMTAAFALPELVLGPLPDEKARAVLLGAPSSCMEASKDPC